MDKKTILGIVVVAVLFLGFAYVNTKQQEKYQQEMAAWQAYQDSVAAASRPAVPAADSAAGGAAESAVAASGETAAPEAEADLAQTVRQRRIAAMGEYLTAAQEAEPEEFTVENEVMTVRFSTRGGQITGVTLKELTNEENLPGVLKKLAYNTLDDMYAAIGYGGVTSLKLIGRLREDIQRILHQHQAERQAEVPVEGQPEVTRPAVPVREHSEQGIVVQGLSNCLVKFSKCCSPVPGDEIVGFITRGYGVSVHRKDCPNADPARRPPEEVGRWIKVSWGGKTRESYRTNLQVVSKDRPNLLVDISTILSAAKVHVSSLNARSTADGFALISLAVDVSDSQQLQAVMRRLEQISGVMRVTRPAG